LVITKNRIGPSRTMRVYGGELSHFLLCNKRTLILPLQHYRKMTFEMKQSVRKGGRRNRRRGGVAFSGSTNNSMLSNFTALSMPLFPASTIKWLRYSTNFMLTNTAGAVATYVFRANDCFDIDFTGTGHQPMGFDQMMVFYNHFCVTHAQIKVVFKNTSTSAPTTVCIRQDASSTPLTVIDRILEAGYYTTEDLEATPGFGSNKLLSCKMSIARMQGVSESALTADPTLRGDAATSPTEITYFHCASWNDQGSTTGCAGSVLIEQRVVFMEPRDATESLSKRLDDIKSELGSFVTTPFPSSKR